MSGKPTPVSPFSQLKIRIFFTCVWFPAFFLEEYIFTTFFLGQLTEKPYFLLIDIL